MSTRSNIYLKLKDETKGQTLKFDFSKLPYGNGEMHEKLEFPIKDIKVPAWAQYMRVYHHWDGYITGVGKTLLETYKDYDTILNLLIMGDLSTINGGVNSYQGWRNENCPARFIGKSSKVTHWEWDSEKQESKTIKMSACNSKGELKAKEAICEEYAYLFDGEKWWVAYYKYNEDEDKCYATDWLDLKTELEKELNK